MAQEKHHQIVIIGGGTGGIMTAAQLLRKRKSLDIAIIEPSDKHYYQPAWTLVGAGTYSWEKTIRPEASVMPKEVTWIKDYATAIEPDDNYVQTQSSGKITYDYLVAAPGIQIDLDGIEGLKEAMGTHNVCSNYVDPNYTWELLQQFKGGNAIFTQPTTPIKCGGAPQKIMYLFADYVRKHNLSDKTDILFATPGSVIFGVEEFANTLLQVVDRYNISLKLFSAPVKIDGPNRKVYFKLMGDSPEQSKTTSPDTNRFEEKMVEEGLVEMPYDFLHLAPPQSAPDFIKQSKIAHQEGPSKGWINVNINTLKHNAYDNVFALGDAAALPTAKTGAAIRKQAPVLVENLLHTIDNDEKFNEGYSGYSSCPLVTGYGKMLLAEFDYENKPMSDPLLKRLMNIFKEHWRMWILKKYGLPYLYWNMMMKGRM